MLLLFLQRLRSGSATWLCMVAGEAPPTFLACSATHTHRQSRVLQSNTFWPAWHFFSSMTLSERLHTPTEQCCLATACAIEKWMCSCFKQAIYTRDSYTLLFKEVSLQTFTLAFCSACHKSHEAKTKGGTTSTKGSNEKLRSVNTQFVLQMSSRFFSSGSSI